MSSKELRSFKNAIKGLRVFFSTQPHARFHAMAGIHVIAAGFLFHLKRTEWGLILVSIGLVIVAEAANTAIEFLTDLVSPDFNEQAGKVKDIAAGAVLAASIIAAIIGLVVFLPKIFF